MMKYCEYIHMTKVIEQNKNIHFNNLPPDVTDLIVGYKNDMEMRDIMMYRMHRHVLHELQEDIVNEVWGVLMEIYWEYEQCYAEWCHNDWQFDEDLTESLRDKLYELYDEYKHLLIPHRYIPAKYCNCCKQCSCRRVDITQHLLDDCGSKGWRRYNIGQCPCDTYGCVRVCDVFYNLEFRKLWTSRW